MIIVILEELVTVTIVKVVMMTLYGIPWKNEKLKNRKQTWLD